jgi:hypothetical protein
MSNYKPDLELRRRVAEAAGYDRVHLYNDDTFIWEFDGEDKEPPEYERSFDAIMPLIHDREFWKAHQKDIILYMQNLLEGGFFMDGTNFIESANMFIFELRPSDWCRAYVAVKGDTK